MAWPDIAEYNLFKHTEDKTMKRIATILKIVLAICASTGLACIAIMSDWRDSAVFAVFLFSGILIALVLGAFDIKDESNHWSIKHGARSMRRAA